MILFETATQEVSCASLALALPRHLFAYTLCAMLCLAGATKAQSQNNGLSVDDAGEVSVEFPRNNLGEDEFVPAADDSQQREVFNRIINDAAKPYLKFAADNDIFLEDSFEPGKLYPAKFIVDDVSRDWTSTIVNSEASQIPPSGPNNPSSKFAKWTIYIYGALFRRPEISRDGFALVVCHELGHLFGGFYFYVRHWGEGALGLAAEGEADYFATQSCLRRLWRNQDNNPPYVGPFDRSYQLSDIPKTIIERCDKEWANSNDRLLCYRSGVAGLSVGALWGAIAKDRGECETTRFPWPCQPDPATPDTSQIDRTFQTHPTNPQCRLDTYLAGAYCRVEFRMPTDGKVMPGTFNNIPENTLRAREEAFAHSCFSAKKVSPGARPRCWFNPEDVQEK